MCSTRGTVVGSYSDLYLHFTFRANTPEDVLAAFSPLVVESTRTPDAPTLPAPSPEPWPDWDPEYRTAYGIEPGDPEIDPAAAEPWRHDWASHLGGKMSWWPWEQGWHYETLASFKTDQLTIHRFIDWLGPFVKSRHPSFPAFAGHIVIECAPRPFLLMGIQDELVLEDTNPADFIY